MAIRNIRLEEDSILRKVSREIDIIDDRIIQILQDMTETMYKFDGVGLAAVQVGILKRLIVIDIGEGLIQLINPVIAKEKGTQEGVEGCLSLPSIFGEVKRPKKVIVEARNINGENITIEGEGLLAIVLSHEIDHTNGILFKDKAIKILTPEEFNKRKEERRQGKSS